MRKKGTTNMPKMKTKRAAAKRLKATATGKLMRRSGWKRHLLEAKSPKRRRKLRKASLIAKVDVPRLKRLVPYL
jgi:large subunit ribosomal protein L35